MKKSNLDEMQEQELLKIEHNGCYLAFYGLLLAMAIQGIFGVAPRELLGEWIVFMVLGIYLVAGCLRHGIWDQRYLKLNSKTNLLASILAGLGVGVFTAVRNAGYSRTNAELILIGVIPAVCTFVLVFVTLSVCALLYRKRREKLDKE